MDCSTDLRHHADEISDYGVSSPSVALPVSRAPVLAQHQSSLNPVDPAHRDLVTRLSRDTQICHLLAQMLDHLDTRSIEKELAKAQNENPEHPQDRTIISEFERLSRDLFSQLDALGVHPFYVSGGRSDYNSLSCVDFIAMYRILSAHRTALEMGTFPLAGAEPLSVRPYPDRRLEDKVNFRSMLSAESPQYSVTRQTYTASAKPFQGFFARHLLPDSPVTYHPHIKEAREFLYYLERELLPDLHRAVANYTALLRMNSVKDLAVAHPAKGTMQLIEHMYYIHDRAVGILGDIEQLMAQGKDELRTGSPSIETTMEEIHTQLYRLGSLEVEWADKHGNHKRLPDPRPVNH